MLSHKLLFVSATMLATTTVASVSFADDTSRPSVPATGTSGSSSISSSTVMSPSTPSVPTTSTTVTSQGTPSSTVPPATPPATTPTSTTTTTSADSSEAPPTTPPPPQDSVTVYKKQRPNKALLITGGSILAGTYVTTAALAAANGPVADHDLYIPVVGPWVNLANRSCEGECKSTETRDVILIAGSGVLQGIGAAMLVTSFFVPEKVPTARIEAGNVKVRFSPTAGPGAGGLGATGTF